jgi:hypothetical protein
MEKKVRVNAKKKGEFVSLSDEELVFTESTKEPCETCKEPKEIEVKMEKYTKQEMDLAMTMVDRYNLTRQEIEWLTNLNNRVLNDRKRAGCGKCLVQVKKNLANAYQRLYG